MTTSINITPVPIAIHFITQVKGPVGCGGTQLSAQVVFKDQYYHNFLSEINPLFSWNDKKPTLLESVGLGAGKPNSFLKDNRWFTFDLEYLSFLNLSDTALYVKDQDKAKKHGYMFLMSGFNNKVTAFPEHPGKKMVVVLMVTLKDNAITSEKNDKAYLQAVSRKYTDELKQGNQNAQWEEKIIIDYLLENYDKFNEIKQAFYADNPVLIGEPLIKVFLAYEIPIDTVLSQEDQTLRLENTGSVISMRKFE